MHLSLFSPAPQLIFPVFFLILSFFLQLAGGRVEKPHCWRAIERRGMVGHLLTSLYYTCRYNITTCAVRQLHRFFS
ncbi:hypothetical protein DFH27DRAFT_540973 [Peziza echinospora]|nr:hypothetical protein DFH27DRAFT_540973 [Peziza echinospora]